MYKILIVDDEPCIREGLKKIIDEQQSNFCVCGEAEDGKEALELIEQFFPDIVITDIRMIEIDGPELIKMVVEKYNHKIKFIIVSAYGEFQYAQMAIKYGVYDYILKPINPKELIETINRIILKIIEADTKENDYRIALEIKMKQKVHLLLEDKATTVEYNELIDNFKFFENQWVRCVLIKFSENLSKNNSAITKLLMNLLTINAEIKIITEENQSSYLCIIEEGNSDIPKEKIYERLFIDERWKKYRKEITVFLGRRVMGVFNIKESYQDVLLGYKERFYLNDKLLVFIEDILKHNKIRDEKHELEKLPYLNYIDEKIHEKDENAMKKNISLLFEYLIQHFIEPSLVKIKLIIFAINMNDKIAEFGGENQRITENKVNLFNFDIELMNIVDLMSIFTQFCMDSIVAFSEINSDKQNDVIYKIQRYLQNNYKAYIKMNEIASEFYMNPVYLGQIFKKKTGITINEYLNNLRIQEAKKLLKYTNYKVYEISTMIGFVNSDYFTTKFEKIVGVTPLHYRKESLKN